MANRHDRDVEVNGVRLMAISTRLVAILQSYDVAAVARDGLLIAARRDRNVTGTVTVADTIKLLHAASSPRNGLRPIVLTPVRVHVEEARHADT